MDDCLPKGDSFFSGPIINTLPDSFEKTKLKVLRNSNKEFVTRPSRQSHYLFSPRFVLNPICKIRRIIPDDEIRRIIPDDDKLSRIAWTLQSLSLADMVTNKNVDDVIVDDTVVDDEIISISTQEFIPKDQKNKKVGEKRPR